MGEEARFGKNLVPPIQVLTFFCEGHPHCESKLREIVLEMVVCSKKRSTPVLPQASPDFWTPLPTALKRPERSKQCHCLQFSKCITSLLHY